MQYIPPSWFNDKNSDNFNTIVNNLLRFQKVPRFTYSILADTTTPDKSISFWNHFAEDSESLD